MRDKRFGDAVLDFNLFFLGFKSDHLKIDGAYDRTVFGFPNAVAAAQELLKGGDYFKLFDLEGPFYMAPLGRSRRRPAATGRCWPLAEQLRRKAMGEIEVGVRRCSDLHRFQAAAAQARHCAPRSRRSPTVSSN